MISGPESVSTRLTDLPERGPGGKNFLDEIFREANLRKVNRMTPATY